MKDLGPSTSEAMVAEFLRAEVDSSRFGSPYAPALKALGYTREQLIDNADLSDPDANEARARMLAAFRGYGQDKFLFTRFPANAQWKRVQLDLADFEVLMYANHPDWVAVSGPGRLVVDGARNIRTATSPFKPVVLAVAERVTAGHKFADLIAVERGASLVLMEGHTRATAYAVAPILHPVTVHVARAPLMSQWLYF
jgi:hypothetical protein